YISKGLLIILGIKTIADGIKNSRRGYGEEPCKDIGCIFDMAGSPEKADCDSSREISPKEAAVLGAALSVDSVFTGMGAGIGGASPPLIFALSFLCGVIACGLGRLAGEAVRGKNCPKKFPVWLVTGAGLIVIAVIF
ncbi:MAG: hypothetical protein NC078_07605, partial [Ruminococcus sp.]|nr:hypothetical protein [Ruminococcus sp.]